MLTRRINRQRRSRGVDKALVHTSVTVGRDAAMARTATPDAAGRRRE
jgi:hypothetical protein